MFDVKRIEGRRWHKGVNYWSVPASLRAWKKLDALSFTMMEFGGGRRYVKWLSEGCPVGYGQEGVDGLFPYQKQGVMRLLTRPKMVLADDPGLGKTWQAIEWARRKQHRKLVVAPKVVLGQWREQIYARYAFYGDVPKSVSLRASTWGVGEWNIVNYEFLPKLQEVGGDFDLIVDEAHLCTNMKTARTRSILRLSSTSTRSLLLTGTPPAKPRKLWPFFVACAERDPKEFFPYALRYCGAERNDFGWDFSGATHLDELRDEITHFVLRRTKEEVMSDLPPLLTSVLKVDEKTGTVGERNAISKADDSLMDLISKGHSISSSEGLGALQRLRVLTSKQKIGPTVEYVKSLGAVKVVIFCEFRETMNQLTELLLDSTAEEALIVAQIHGDVPESRREELTKWFSKPSETAEVLILQSGLGGLALDGLQVAQKGIIHDLPYTKDQLDQMISRLHRQGQKSSVNITYMVSTSVVEQKMVKGIQEGRELHEVMYGS